jgi:putative flavoprotein involved in K+ transport
MTTTTRIERYDTIIIGGGQAGLAAGYHLAQRGIDFTIVTNESRIGDNWRRRWDSLRLFTPAAHSGLPGMPFPAPSNHLADKDEVADYLERYAERFDLPVRLGTTVRRLRHDGERHIIETDDVTLEAETVIVATGAFQHPRVPAEAARLSPLVHQLHSSAYVSPFQLPEGSVLVVGAGNSGAQIALELARHRKVWLSGRNTGHMPRRVLGRDIFDWIWPVISRAHAGTRLGARMKRDARRGDALIGIPERLLEEGGVKRVARLDDVRNGMPVCGSAVLQPRVVVWCTGFVPDYSWIDLPALDADGYPRHARGESRDVPGLYFLGLRFQHSLTSSLIGGVGSDAAWVTERVANRAFAMVR